MTNGRMTNGRMTNGRMTAGRMTTGRDDSGSSSEPIDAATVAHVARLARLHLDEAEATAMRADLSAILGYVAELAAVDTQGVEPMLHPAGTATPQRADAIAAGLPRDAALANAPLTADRHFVLPRFVHGDAASVDALPRS